MTPILVHRQSGEQAFERLYRSHVQDVYRYALMILRNRDDAEDVAQTTFLKAYRAYQRGERPRHPRQWLITIAHNTCGTRIRDARRRPREVALEEQLVEPTPVGGARSTCRSSSARSARSRSTSGQRSSCASSRGARTRRSPRCSRCRPPPWRPSSSARGAPSASSWKERSRAARPSACSRSSSTDASRRTSGRSFARTSASARSAPRSRDDSAHGAPRCAASARCRCLLRSRPGAAARQSGAASRSRSPRCSPRALQRSAPPSRRPRP